MFRIIVSSLLLYFSVEVHGLRLVTPSIKDVADTEDTISSCREYAVQIISADWEYNKHKLAELLPEQREYRQESAVSFAGRQVDKWETQGYDYCPFVSASSSVVGAEAMNSRISQGHWMFVSEDEYNEWFIEQEIKALHVARSTETIWLFYVANLDCQTNACQTELPANGPGTSARSRCIWLGRLARSRRVVAKPCVTWCIG